MQFSIYLNNIQEDIFHLKKQNGEESRIAKKTLKVFKNLEGLAIRCQISKITTNNPSKINPQTHIKITAIAKSSFVETIVNGGGGVSYFLV